MKVACITPVFNEETLIEGCIKSVAPLVDQHIVLVSQAPYYGENRDPDKTAEIAESLGADVVYGTWGLDHTQRNAGIALLQDYDWIICTDVDMWLTKEDGQRLFEILESADNEAFVIRQKSYWKTTDYRIVDDHFMPVIAIKPNVRFSHIGNIDHSAKIIDEICVHHINWCEPKDIYKKVTTYSHAPEFDGKRWYKECYEPWEESDTAVLPTGVYRIAKEPLPEELKAYLGTARCC